MRLLESYTKMCTSVTFCRRQSFVYQVALLLLLNALHESSSTYRSSPAECNDYPKVCVRESATQNNCTVTPSNQMCHYSQNDSLQQSDLFSLFGQRDDVPESPENLFVGVSYIVNEEEPACMPKLEFSWKPPSDENSSKWLTGFALNVSFFYKNERRQTVRIFFVENEVSHNALFKYECYLAIPGVSYTATIYSLPTNLRNTATQIVSVSCSSPYAVHQRTSWRALMDVSVLSNGSIAVHFMPAPINFNFPGYKVWLSTKNNVCRNKLSNVSKLSRLCPEEVRAVLNTTTALDFHSGFAVCVQPDKCALCKMTWLIVDSVAANREQTTQLDGVTNAVTAEDTTSEINGIMAIRISVTTASNPSWATKDGVLPADVLIGAIFVGLLVLCIVLTVLVLSGRIHPIGRQCHRKGLNAAKKYIFLISDAEAKLKFIDVIERLSVFVQLCNKCEVVQSDSCNSCSVRALKRRIDLADTVLIIRSADATSRIRTGAGRNFFWQNPETKPADGDMFHSSLKIIKRHFQTEATHTKFRQIILPRCHHDDRSTDAGLLDLKVQKTYRLMEFIHELWENNKTISGNFRTCYEALQELERAIASANCCTEQCRSYTNKTCQHNDEQPSSNDSERTPDDDGYKSTEAPCCACLLDPKSQMTNVRSELSEFICKDVDLDDTFSLESGNSSSEATSLANFSLFFDTLNQDFDRTVQADGIDNERAIGPMHLLTYRSISNL